MSNMSDCRAMPLLYQKRPPRRARSRAARPYRLPLRICGIFLRLGHIFSGSLSMELTYLPKAWKRGTDFLGTRYAILCGAMTWVSESSLVSAISNAGGFGVLAGANMPPDLLAKEIAATRSKTRHPFGVNMITVAPNYRAH